MGDDHQLAALVGLLVVLLLLSAFFSGSETALMSLNRYQLRHKARHGHRGRIDIRRASMIKPCFYLFSMERAIRPTPLTVSKTVISTG